LSAVFMLPLMKLISSAQTRRRFNPPVIFDIPHDAY
jgi:hypothetical protein